jgi:hypothetical protein
VPAIFRATERRAHAETLALSKFKDPLRVSRPTPIVFVPAQVRLIDARLKDHILHQSADWIVGEGSYHGSVQTKATL